MKNSRFIIMLMFGHGQYHHKEMIYQLETISINNSNINKLQIFFTHNYKMVVYQ